MSFVSLGYVNKLTEIDFDTLSNSVFLHAGRPTSGGSGLDFVLGREEATVERRKLENRGAKDAMGFGERFSPFPSGQGV